MSNVCFIDTETLGLDPDVNPVWEVGLILPDGTEREWQVKVTEREISLAHPVALEISHFHERYGKARAVDLPEHVARDLYDLIPERCHLVGAVPSFDEERLRRLMWRHGYSPRWHYHLIDIEALAVGWLRGYTAGMEEDDVPIPLPWKSDDLSRECGVEPPGDDEKHTALGDARWAKRLYERICGPVGRR